MGHSPTQVKYEFWILTRWGRCSCVAWGRCSNNSKKLYPSFLFPNCHGNSRGPHPKVPGYFCHRDPDLPVQSIGHLRSYISHCPSLAPSTKLAHPHPCLRTEIFQHLLKLGFPWFRPHLPGQFFIRLPQKALHKIPAPQNPRVVFLFRISLPKGDDSRPPTKTSNQSAPH